jgi:hypothetical protein
VELHKGVKGGANKPWRPRYHVSRKRGTSPERQPIENDPAFKTYIAKLNKPEKQLPRKQYFDCIAAAYYFLKSYGKPITDHTLSDLTKQKEDDPEDMTTEKALTIFKSTPPTRTNTPRASRMVGLFKANFVPLNVHIWVRSGSPSKPVAESILRAIRQDSELQQIHCDLIDLMAYSGERIQALAMTPPEDITFIEETNTAIINMRASRSKTATEHPTCITKDLAERLLQRAQEYGYPVILPTYDSLFRTVTKLSEKKYEIHFTSHYLRKRYETICETVPANEVNPNHWLILMGDKPSYGHRPRIYSLRSDEQLAKEWETHLLPRLDLSGRNFETKQTPPTWLSSPLGNSLLDLFRVHNESLDLVLQSYYKKTPKS